MPIPQNNRIVHESLIFSNFKYIEVRYPNLLQIKLTLAKYKALYFTNCQDYSPVALIKNSKRTHLAFTQLMERSRNTFANFIINSKLLSILGEIIYFRKNIISCKGSGHMLSIDTKI